MTEKFGLHVTDCGLNTTNGQGGDTQARIKSLYHHLGVSPELIRKTSAIGVAFSVASAAEAVTRITKKPHQPIAFNRAPRTQHSGKKAAGGGKLLYLKGGNGCEYVGYGEEVLEWLNLFQGEVESVVSIDSWPDREIADTTKGTQFRSLEYLVPIHSDLLTPGSAALASAKTTSFNPEKFHFAEDEAVVLPVDEFTNGRLLLRREKFDALIEGGRFKLEGVLGDEVVSAVNSLTEAEGLALWPSSNRLFNKDLVVANFGKKWSEDHAENDSRIRHLQEGERLKISS